MSKKKTKTKRNEKRRDDLEESLIDLLLQGCDESWVEDLPAKLKAEAMDAAVVRARGLVLADG